MKAEEKQFGDLIVKDDEELGFSIFEIDKPDDQICYFNKKGEEELAQWILGKQTIGDADYKEVRSVLNSLLSMCSHKRLNSSNKVQLRATIGRVYSELAWLISSLEKITK